MSNGCRTTATATSSSGAPVRDPRARDPPKLPVRLGAERLGRIDLGEVFSRHAQPGYRPVITESSLAGNSSVLHGCAIRRITLRAIVFWSGRSRSRTM